MSRTDSWAYGLSERAPDKENVEDHELRDDLWLSGGLFWRLQALLFIVFAAASKALRFTQFDLCLKKQKFPSKFHLFAQFLWILRFCFFADKILSRSKV